MPLEISKEKTMPLELLQKYYLCNHRLGKLVALLCKEILPASYFKFHLTFSNPFLLSFSFFLGQICPLVNSNVFNNNSLRLLLLEPILGSRLFQTNSFLYIYNRKGKLKNHISICVLKSCDDDKQHYRKS